LTKNIHPLLTELVIGDAHYIGLFDHSVCIFYDKLTEKWSYLPAMQPADWMVVTLT